MRVFLPVLFAAQILITSSSVLALTLDDALKLVLAGDVAAVETAFQNHQAEFEAKTFARDAYVAAYRAFETPFTRADAGRPEFGCTRFRLLERHARDCAWDERHQSCRGGKRRDTMIARAQDQRVCGEKRPDTSQYRVRNLFESNE